MKIEHVALWTHAIEPMREFYERYFDAQSGARYASATTPGFLSYFLAFPRGGSRLELMALPELAAAPVHPAQGYVHIAIAVGSRTDVDRLTERMRADGVRVLSEPRQTGDGYYESVVADPDGNQVELAADDAA